MALSAIKLPPDRAHLDRLGLSANPFPLAPDAGRYFLTEALEVLVYELLFCIQQRKGFLVVSGEVGLGKTTLSRYLVGQLSPQEYSVAVVLNSMLQGDDLLHQICLDFGLIQEDADPPGRAMINRLNEFFLEQRRAGKNCVIFIDDAQNLTTASLELIRVLSNLETDTEKLVQVILIGQQELREKLARPELRQLASRVALDREILPLIDSELRRYIDYKLAISSSTGLITLTNGAHRAVAAYARGNLRRANRLLDRVLIALLGQPRREITQALVKRAILDLSHPAEGEKNPRKLVGGLGVASLAFCLPLIAVAVFWDDHSRLASAWERLSQAAGEGVQRIISPDSGTTQADQRIEVEPKDVVQHSDSDVVEHEWRAAEELDAVLTELGLTESAELWLEALAIGDPAVLVQTVLRPAGLVLIRDRGNLNIDHELELSIDQLFKLELEDARERWWIWRPRFAIGTLSFMLQTPDVAVLQRHLAAAGHYQHEVDGIAGSQTISGVMAFQREKGLPVTGQVDDLTLLLLHRFSSTDSLAVTDVD